MGMCKLHVVVHVLVYDSIYFFDVHIPFLKNVVYMFGMLLAGFEHVLGAFVGGRFWGYVWKA